MVVRFRLQSILFFLGAFVALVQSQTGAAIDKLDRFQPEELNQCFQIVSEAKSTVKLGDFVSPTHSTLGKGIMGGKVSRVTDPETGRVHVEKKFFNEDFLKNDLLAQKVLQKIFSEYPDERYSLIETLGVDKDLNTLYLEWIPGESVQKKLFDWNQPADRQIQLALLYSYKSFVTYFVDSLNRYLQDYPETLQEDDESMRSVTPTRARFSLKYKNEQGEWESFFLGIHDANVILQDSPRRMVLVDPH